MKKPLLLLMALVMSMFTMAQWSVGVNVGANIDQPRVNTQYAYTRTYTCGAGAVLALPVQYNFLDWVGLVLEPNWQYRSTRYNQAQWYEEKQHDLYMEVPLMVDFSFGGKKVRGFARVGGYIGGWLASWRDCTMDGREYEVIQQQFTDQQCRFDAGVVGGLGLRWLTDRKVSMSLEYRYYYDCLSSEKPHKVGSYNRYDNLHTITLGVHFNCVQPQKEPAL